MFTRSAVSSFVMSVVLLSGLVAGHAVARTPLIDPLEPDAATCVQAIRSSQRDPRLPEGLLYAIALVESGRTDPMRGRTSPWAWTINAGGIGHTYASKAEAIVAVRELQALGVRSIDVGCMQINLMYHPDAFSSLDVAFEPEANVRYAVQFLSSLRAQTGEWSKAAAAYHSQTPDIGATYEQKVMALWPGNPRAIDIAARSGNLPPVRDDSHYTAEFAAQLREADRARAHQAAAVQKEWRKNAIVWVTQPGDATPLPTLAQAQPPVVRPARPAADRRKLAQQP